MGMEQGSIMVLEKKKKLVVHAASRPELIGVEQPLDKKSSISAVVARTGVPEVIDDISKDKRFTNRTTAAKSSLYRTKSLLSAPILHPSPLPLSPVRWRRTTSDRHVGLVA